MKKLIGFGLAALVIGGLALNNPSAHTVTAAEMARIEQNQPLPQGHAPTDYIIARNMVSQELDAALMRTNFGIASYYTAYVAGSQRRFLAVAGRVIFLENGSETGSTPASLFHHGS